MLFSIGKKTNNEKDMNSFNIFKELKEKFMKPWKVSFVLYFVFIIILFGGMGVIVALVNAFKSGKWDGIPLSLMTYSLALLVPACITILLQYLPLAKNKVSLVILSIAILVVTSLMAFFNSFVIAIICIFLAWFFWIIANSENEYLDDDAYDKSIKQDLVEHGKDWN